MLLLDNKDLMVEVASTVILAKQNHQSGLHCVHQSFHNVYYDDSFKNNIYAVIICFMIIVKWPAFLKKTTTQKVDN